VFGGGVRKSAKIDREDRRESQKEEDLMVLYLCVLGVQGGEGEKKDGYANAPKQHIRYGFFIAVHIASI